MPLKKILIVKNFSLETPGLIEEVLNENSLNYEIINLDEGKNFPNPNDYSAIFVLGGPDSANDRTPKMIGEIKRIRQAIGAGVPYFGICLGMQALVKASGGEVYKNRIKEIGLKGPSGNFFEISLTDAGRKDKLFEGIESPMKIFQLHGETVSLSPASQLLATGEYCTNQTVKIGKSSYGFQGHLELNDTLFGKLIAEDLDLRRISPSSLRADYNSLKSEYQSNGRVILNNFLKIANLK